MVDLSPKKKRIEFMQSKQMDINEKLVGDKFKKLSGMSNLNNLMIYDVKISR